MLKEEHNEEKGKVSALAKLLNLFFVFLILFHLLYATISERIKREILIKVDSIFILNSIRIFCL